jgi:hypothetical protein
VSRDLRSCPVLQRGQLLCPASRDQRSCWDHRPCPHRSAGILKPCRLCAENKISVGLEVGPSTGDCFSILLLDLLLLLCPAQLPGSRIQKTAVPLMSCTAAGFQNPENSCYSHVLHSCRVPESRKQLFYSCPAQLPGSRIQKTAVPLMSCTAAGFQNAETAETWSHVQLLLRHCLKKKCLINYFVIPLETLNVVTLLILTSEARYQILSVCVFDGQRMRNETDACKSKDLSSFCFVGIALLFVSNAAVAILVPLT